MPSTKSSCTASSGRSIWKRPGSKRSPAPGVDRMSTTFNIAVLPGDGIGVDVMAEAVKGLQALEGKLDGVKFAFHSYSVGAGEYLRHGDPLPAEAFAACREADAVLLGAMGLPD